MSRSRTVLPAVVLLALAAATIWPWAPPADGQDSDLSGVPQAECGPGSDPEGDIQGRVPAADFDSGRIDRPYTCNTELVGHHGSSGGFKVHRYVDAQGQECGYYDSQILLGVNTIQQLSTGAGVIVLDMGDPANPVATAELVTPGMLSPHESLVIAEDRGLLMAASGTAATLPAIVDVYDIADDCTQPVLQASAPVGFLGHESGLSPDGMTLYVSSTGGDSIIPIDVSDPTLPTPLSFLPLNSHGMTVSADGTRLYTTPLDVDETAIPGPPTLGGFAGGIAIIDVSAIQAREPFAQGEILSTLTWPEASIPQTAIPVEIDGHPYLVEIDEFVGFPDILDPQGAAPGVARIIDIADETAPFVVSNIRLDVHDPEVRNGDAGLEDDPGNNLGPGSFAQGYAGHYCAVPRPVDPGIVACSMIMSGLRVFDIRDPHNPTEIAYFNTVTTDVNTLISPGGAYAMSAPAFVPERGEIWYSDANSGFHAVRVTNDVWPFDDGRVVQRLAGPDRVGTAVAASTETFPARGADGVVLARADDFADALAGGPLAVALDGPVLLSGTDALPEATAQELTRVLPAGGTVTLLGGTAALSAAVEAAVADLGFAVERIGGATRFETAALVARDGLGSPGEVVLADGGTFTDALVAAPVAASRGAALLLTDGAAVPGPTAAYLEGATGTTAIGPDAVAALPSADTVITGESPAALSVAVARAAFPGATAVGIARDDDFPDALTAGAVLGRDDGGPVLLVGRDRLPGEVAGWLGEATALRRILLFGGTAALTPAGADAVESALPG